MRPKTEVLAVVGLAGLILAQAAQAVMWFPVVNDALTIISLNQESLVSQGTTVAGEFQYVFQRTETLPYADDRSEEHTSELQSQR